MRHPFDSVLLIAFGGPQHRDHVRPFLENVLRGRRVAPERVDEVEHHYALFDGISPITEITTQQAGALHRTLAAAGMPLPVYVGMRNWDPYVRDTLAQMSRDGMRRAVGVIAAAHRSYSSCLQYRENVREARAALRTAGLPDVSVTYVPDWHVSGGFVDAAADQAIAAFESLAPEVRDASELVFTAHSIPLSMAQQYPYQHQLRESCQAVADEMIRRMPARKRLDWTLVYQSRSGRPEDPWLEPDVSDYLRDAHARGVPGVVLSPIGFVADHIEVLYDLDVEAAAVARELDLPLARAAAVNVHPRFIDALADAVRECSDRHRQGHPLDIAPTSHPPARST